MRRNGPREHRHQHVERQEDLRHADPHVQELLEPAEAPDGPQNVIKVHVCACVRGGFTADGPDIYLQLCSWSVLVRV